VRAKRVEEIDKPAQRERNRKREEMKERSTKREK
jgi:hypothetical protein